MYERVFIAWLKMDRVVQLGWFTWEDVRDDFDLYTGDITLGYIL